MKKSLFILALAALAASCTHTPTDMQSSNNAKAVYDCILTRTSVRQFTAAPISEAQIDTLLRAAMAAPSAVNKQPWEFVVITDRATLDTIGSRFPNTRISSNVQVAFALCGNLHNALESHPDYWIHDVSACAENLLLAAHSMGLGAVWCGIYPTDRVAGVQEILHLPDYILPLCIIPVGHPAESPAPKDKWNPERVHYNRW